MRKAMVFFSLSESFNWDTLRYRNKFLVFFYRPRRNISSHTTGAHNECPHNLPSFIRLAHSWLWLMLLSTLERRKGTIGFMKNAEFQDGFETATARFLLLLGIVQRKKTVSRQLAPWTIRPRQLAPDMKAPMLRWKNIIECARVFWEVKYVFMALVHFKRLHTKVTLLRTDVPSPHARN